MKRKTILALILGFALLFGCASTAFAASEPTSGSWKINKKTGNYLTKSEKKTFKKATRKMTGATFNPVYTLGTQVVAGTNYAFFCQETTTTRKPVTSWKVMIVYKDLKGKAKVTSINKFNYKDVVTQDDPYTKKNASGSWSYNLKAYKSKGIPKDALKAFKKANKTYDGVGLTPIVLLGKQPVSGTNYRFLARGVMMNRKTLKSLYVVDVYKNTKGSCKITDCDVVNLDNYLNQ